VSSSRQLALPFESIDPAARSARRAAVRELSEGLVRRARERWPSARIGDVRVEFGLRGRAAGDACPSTGTTRYNSELLDRYGDEFVRSIVPHEVAHIVTWAVFGRVKPHGPEWRSVMEFFGVDPSVTHDFETTPARRVRRVPYRCSCGIPHRLTKRAHLRIRRGTVEYRCRSCGDLLVHVE
jgi:SprT protein